VSWEFRPVILRGSLNVAVGVDPIRRTRAPVHTRPHERITGEAACSKRALPKISSSHWAMDPSG